MPGSDPVPLPVHIDSGLGKTLDNRVYTVYHWDSRDWLPDIRNVEWIPGLRASATMHYDDAILGRSSMYSRFVFVVAAQIVFGFAMVILFACRRSGQPVAVGVAGKIAAVLSAACSIVAIGAPLTAGRFLAGREYWLGLSAGHHMQVIALVGVIACMCGWAATAAISVYSIDKAAKEHTGPSVQISSALLFLCMWILAPLGVFADTYPWKLYLAWLPLGILWRIAGVGLVLAIIWDAGAWVRAFRNPERRARILGFQTGEPSVPDLRSRAKVYEKLVVYSWVVACTVTMVMLVLLVSGAGSSMSQSALVPSVLLAITVLAAWIFTALWMTSDAAYRRARPNGLVVLAIAASFMFLPPALTIVGSTYAGPAHGAYFLLVVLLGPIAAYTYLRTRPAARRRRA